MSKEKTFFNEKWLSTDHDEKFFLWLLPAEKNTQGRCKRCKTTFELSNMGIHALRSHASGKKHKDLTEKITHFFNGSAES